MTHDSVLRVLDYHSAYSPFGGIAQGCGVLRIRWVHQLGLFIAAFTLSPDFSGASKSHLKVTLVLFAKMQVIAEGILLSKGLATWTALKLGPSIIITIHVKSSCRMRQLS